MTFCGDLPFVPSGIHHHLFENWHVENKLHWRLDVVMNEDDCKIRRGNAAELFSGIRHIAINILRDGASGRITRLAARPSGRC